MHRAVPHVRTRRSLGHTRILKRDPLVSNAGQMSKVMIVTSGLFSGWTFIKRCILSLLRPLRVCLSSFAFQSSFYSSQQSSILLTCFSLCAIIRQLSVFKLFIIVVSFTSIVCSTSMFVLYMRNQLILNILLVAPHFKSITRYNTIMLRAQFDIFCMVMWVTRARRPPMFAEAVALYRNRFPK